MEIFLTSRPNATHLLPSSLTTPLLFNFLLATNMSASLGHLSMPITTSTVLVVWWQSIWRDLGRSSLLYVCVCTHVNAVFLKTWKVFRGLTLFSWSWSHSFWRRRGKWKKERGNAALGRRYRQLAALWLCLDVFKKQPNIWQREIFPTCFISKYSSKASTGYRILLWSGKHTLCWSF